MNKIRSLVLIGLILVHSLAFATTDTGTGQPESTESTFDILAWMLSFLPF